MEKETVKKKPKQHLPQSVIDFYSAFRNKNTLRVSNIVGTKFEMEERYEILDSIGKGSYGVVVAAKDNLGPPEKRLIAIKKVEKVFQHKLFTKRTLRELRILRLLSHDNITSIISLLLPKSREEFDDLYIIYDLMETDLYTIIRSPQPITDDHCQFFLYQILRGLKYIHSTKILHRDLKTRNILINSNCDIKICDFGLARPLISGLKSSAKFMTNYVATRWYRAPELLLKCKEYSFAVDVWSVGCIFAEILRRKPFIPGSDSKNQLELIFELLGTPSEEEINKFPIKGAQKFMKSLRPRPSKKFELLFPDVSPLALDILKKMLLFDPDKRITVDQALDHPYLEALHCEDDEVIGRPVDLIDFEFEQYNLTIEQLKDMIYEEILYYNFQEQKKKYLQRKKEGKSLIEHILVSETSQMRSDDDDSEDDVDEGEETFEQEEQENGGNEAKEGGIEVLK